jgi:hypothetical protein
MRRNKQMPHLVESAGGGAVDVVKENLVEACRSD